MEEFEEIYRRYFNDVYRYLRRLSGSESIAEEITAETFLKAMGAIRRFRGQCELRVWLCQIAKNCYYSSRKRALPFPGAEELPEELPDPQLPPEEQVVKREEAARVRAILHTLPEPYKEVFLWRVFGELSFAEIGQIFGKTANWACVTYHRAKTMIQSKTEEKTHET